MAKQITELSWEKRLLVISYDEQEDQIFIKSKKFISDNKCEIEDRNLEIIFYEKFKNKNYAKPEFINNKYYFEGKTVYVPFGCQTVLVSR